MSLFQKHPNQLPIELPIRLIPHRQIQPGLLVHNALIVGKSVKAVPAVVGAHAALAAASEAHLARWMMVSLMQPPPKPQREVTCRATPLSEVKRYRASGWAFELMVRMASSKEV